jgi:predicted RNase H-like nuclease (RuvC/YqgF family)
LETETVAALRAEVETLRTHNSKLYNNVKKFEEERDSARAQLAHQQSVNRELSQHLTSARAEVERRGVRIADLQGRLGVEEKNAYVHEQERDSAQTLLLEALDHQGNLGDCKEHHCSWFREACKIRDSKSAREPIKGRDREPPSAAARADPSPVVTSTFDAIARDRIQKENPP